MPARRRSTSFVRLLLVSIALVAAAAPASAQAPSDGFWAAWFARSDAAKEAQPHWITPLATVTPRLEQEVRWDFVDQAHPDGTAVDSYGGGKGLELIPTDRTEIIVGLPTYVVHSASTGQDGFTDWHVLLKYRLLSRNEAHGNAILTAFFDVGFPTATAGNGVPHPVLTPTIAYGKGFGDFDVQGTFGVSLPVADTAVLGRTYQSNTAAQYRVWSKLWPEVELNATWFQEGRFAGQQQVFVTPGIVVGRIPLNDRLGLTLGAGIQFAVSAFRTSDHNAIVSVRMPF